MVTLWVVSFAAVVNAGHATLPPGWGKERCETNFGMPCDPQTTLSAVYLIVQRTGVEVGDQQEMRLGLTCTFS